MSPRWTPDPDVRRGRSVVYNLHAHLVFTTKYRRGALTDPILTRCEEVMRSVCTDFGAELREFNGDSDHVHLLVHYPPAVALSKLVNSLKGVSARYLRQEHATHLRRYLSGGHLWSPSYFAGSCGGAPLAVVKDYIETRNVPLGDGLPPGPEGPGFQPYALLKSPLVLSISWGEIVVEGAGIVKDAKLYPGGARAWDWNETGTRHSPGIQLADVEELLAHGATVVVLSRGMDLRLEVRPEAVTALQDRDITVHVLETREAVRVYNELAATAPVGALLHSTC